MDEEVRDKTPESHPLGEEDQDKIESRHPRDMADPRRRAQAGGRIGRWDGLLRIVLIIAAVYLVASYLTSRGRHGTEISYSTFRAQLADSNVVAIEIKGNELRGSLRTPAQEKIENGKTEKYTEFTTYVPSVGDQGLVKLLIEKGVDVNAQPQGGFPWSLILFGVLPIFVLIGLMYMLSKGIGAQGQQIFSMGKSRARLYERKAESTTFDDVAGSEGAKTELREIIAFLRDPDRFRKLGGKPPNGILLVGPPGTGKTLLARATAGEAEVLFFSITGSDFMEMFVGVGASRVRSLFKDARDSAPSIVFIDELDSIGRTRGAGLGSGHDEREQTLNQLLSEMDGFVPNESVVVMAATNRPDILDPALLRPGRFDRHVTVELPTAKIRLEILKLYCRGKPLAADVDLDEVARGTPGFSGADLENLVNEAALLATRKKKDVIEREDLEEASDKMMLGLEREGLVLSKDECRLLAYHEAGHAIVAAKVPNADPIHKVTIVPRGRAMGVTQQVPQEEKYIYSKAYLMDRMAVMLGGRASEELVLNTATSGAEDDLKRVTKLARKMVLDWGMSDRLPHLSLDGSRGSIFLGEEIGRPREYSERTAREVDQAVKSIVDEAYERAIGLLRANRKDLDRVAKALLEEEELMSDRILELLGGGNAASEAKESGSSGEKDDAPAKGEGGSSSDSKDREHCRGDGTEN
jgi:cell division protease FtsH